MVRGNRWSVIVVTSEKSSAFDHEPPVIYHIHVIDTSPERACVYNDHNIADSRTLRRKPSVTQLPLNLLVKFIFKCLNYKRRVKTVICILPCLTILTRPNERSHTITAISFDELFIPIKRRWVICSHPCVIRSLVFSLESLLIIVFLLEGFTTTDWLIVNGDIWVTKMEINLLGEH